MVFSFDQCPTLTIHVLDECNQSCKFCFRKKGFLKSNGLTFNEFKELVDKGISQKKIQAVWFGGGEPFMYKFLGEAVDFCKDKGLRTIITTNGQFDFEDQRQIVDDIDIILVSLHSHLPEIHNSLTGNRTSYQNTIKILESLRKLNKKFIINYVCAAENYKTLPEFVKKIFADFSLSLLGLQIFSLKYRGQVLKNKDTWVRFSDLIPYLKNVYDISKEKNLSVSLRDFPLCLVPREISSLRYPQNYIGYIKDKEYIIDSVFARGKAYVEKCSECDLNKECAGVEMNYIKMAGKEEFLPVKR